MKCFNVRRFVCHGPVCFALLLINCIHQLINLNLKKAKFYICSIFMILSTLCVSYTQTYSYIYIYIYIYHIYHILYITSYISHHIYHIIYITSYITSYISHISISHISISHISLSNNLLITHALIG